MIRIYSHKSNKFAITHTTREGRATIVVPVIMARADTVMNGAKIPEDQFHPQSWNGVPVTVQHPESDFGSANDPATLAKWGVGTIFNASYVDGVLRGEAWIDVQKANKVAPGLIDALNSGETMDVSTGYFASDVESTGNLNGKAFTVEHHDLKPDHLALLPGVEGACNWKDGCGVRANRSKNMDAREALLALAKALKINIGKADSTDRKTLVQALIANSKSPYTAEDAKALEAMSEAAFVATVNAFGEDNKEAPVENADGEDDKDVEENEDDPAEKFPAAKQKKNAKEPKVMKQNCGCGGNTHTMSAEDKAALEFGKKQLSSHKAGLVGKLVASTNIKKEEAETFSVAHLETLVNGIKPIEAGSFGGRPVANSEAGNEDTKKMVSGGVVAAIRNSSKKKEAA